MGLADGWLLGQRGGTPPASDTLGIKGWVEYTVRDAQGDIRFQSARHNTKLTAFLNDARDRLGGADGSLTGLGNTDLYDNIQACSADASGGACTLSSNLTANPADGTQSTLAGDGDGGNYQTVVTFTASGGSSTIEELQLTKGAATNGVADTGRGAWQNVSITLASGDTLQVTWTIDID
jgi:hypothetical protein